MPQATLWLTREAKLALLLGIDGGGTGCRAAIADDTGRVLARANGDAANIASDPERARANIIEVAGRVMAMAGCQRIDAAGLGLAGANAAGASRVVDGILPTDRLRLETDAVTATLGALGPRDGIVAAIGTGAVYARRRGADFRQAGGYGLVLGDEGSGAWLGREALSAALQADDGLLPMTPWLSAMIARHGGIGGVIAFAQKASPADFAALAPEIISDSGRDEATRRLVTRAEGRVAAAIAALQSGAADLPVVFIGGLGRFYAHRLQGRFQTVDPTGEPLDGALALARSLL